MKNAINYYYNLVTNDLHHRDNNYYFTVDNDNYLLLPFYGNINYTHSIYNYLLVNRVYCHEIVENRDKQAITVINNIPYMLLKNYIKNRKINIKDIINYTVFISNEEGNNWHNKWCEKLDYYEYQIEQFKKKYPRLSTVFPYYNGMTETAISLLNLIDLNKVNKYLSHNRIGKNTSLIDLYNPINLIIDTRTRDIAEYFKNVFFYEQDPIREVNNYLLGSNLTYDESVLFLARMLYPSYFFDFYDEIINNKIEDKEIYIISSKASDYEMFLKEIYSTISRIYNIPEIEWLKKT